MRGSSRIPALQPRGTSVEGNTIENNEWGIEIGISNVVIVDNVLISNDFGVVIYSPDGPSEGYVYGNKTQDNGMDYVRMTPAGPVPMPEDWFQDPHDTSGDSPSAANSDTAFTGIVIDGQAEDWSSYPMLSFDEEGDAINGEFDLKSVQAFTNDQYLYLMLEAYGNIGEYVQIDVDIDVNGNGKEDYTATFRPRTGRRDFGDFTSGERVWSSMVGGAAAEGEVVELKMPLALIGGCESFSLRRIRVMNGICCGEEWHVVDVMRFVPVTRVTEIELPTPDLANFFLPPGYIAQRIFKPPLQAPNHIAISPSDVIVVTDWGASDRVIQIHKDGTLSTYAAPSPFGAHFGIVFDSESNLYVGDGPGDLWRVTPDGVVTEFATDVWGYQMDIAPSGDIFAIGGDSTFVQRITPDGRVSVYATGLTRVCDLAVSPVTGDVYVYDINAGGIYKANPDGTVRLLTSGLLHEWTYIAFSPDGKLYCMAIDTGLSIISTVDGSRTELTWVKEGWANLHPSDIAFDGLGRLVAVDVTYNHVVRFDLGAKTMEMLWQGMGNTEALAVAPGGGGVYMGFSHPWSDGHGGVVKIEADGSTTPFVDGLPPEVCGLAFDATGTGYVIATGPVGSEWKSTIYSITPAGIKTSLATFPSYGNSLEVDPITGYLWGLSYGELWYLDDASVRHTISTASVGEMVESLTFTPDGTLYVTINTANFWTTSVERGIYRVDPIGPAFTLVADLSTINTCCPMGRIAASQDGNIYWVGNGDRHTPNNETDMHMLRITLAGEVTLFGRKLPMDPSAITGDPNSSDLYFCGGNGVYRVYKP